jgi:uncharacterized protein YebE (UPF0316 family)
VHTAHHIFYKADFQPGWQLTICHNLQINIQHSSPSAARTQSSLSGDRLLSLPQKKMELSDLLTADSWWFTWIILPLLIFLSRIGDQTIGTLRLIFVAKGMRYAAPIAGFFESVIWLLAVGQIMQHLDNIVCFLAYGAGFAAGNFIGMLLEEKISLGMVLVRIIPKKDTSELIMSLREQNYGLTVMDAEGKSGQVKVILSIIKRKDIADMIEIINQYNPNAFYSIEEVKSAKDGVFRAPVRNRMLRLSFGPKKIR